MRVKRLTDEGIRLFYEYILDRAHTGEPPPTHLLEVPFSEPLEKPVEVEKRDFDDKLAAARYLREKLAPLGLRVHDVDRGLWGWISLFYFHQLCPAKPDGRRNPGNPYRYIPETAWSRYYRHLLRGPYHLHELLGEELSPFFLKGQRMHTSGDATEQVASRQDLVTNRGAVALINRLYFDPKGQKRKKGALNSKRGEAGVLRRLLVYLDQLGRTYDLRTLDTDQVLKMLPREFGIWIQEDAPERKDRKAGARRR